jgi:hypothetical protein
MRVLRTLAAAFLFALPASAQLGLSPEGFEGLRVRVRPLGAKFKPEGGQGNDTALAGAPGSNVPIDGFSMRYFRAKLEYQALNQGAAWGPWVKSGETAGTAGKKLDGIRVRVDRGSVRYRVAQVGGDFGGWTADGEAAQVPGGKGIEAIEAEYLNVARPGQTVEYRVAFRGSGFGPWLGPDKAADPERPDADVIAIELRNGGGVKCEIAILGKGWRPTVDEGQTCGDASGRFKVEAFRLFSPHVPLRYRAKLEGLGWTKWAHDGDMCGLIGRSRRLLAVQIQPDPGE